MCILPVTNSIYFVIDLWPARFSFALLQTKNEMFATKVDFYAENRGQRRQSMVHFDG